MLNSSPYKNKALNNIYQMLFCDNIELYQTKEAKDSDPWQTLFSQNSVTEDLQEIIDNPDVETRLKILSYRKLAQIGQPISILNLLGIIVEVGLEGGLDTLAAYKDGTARYINQSEKIIIWDSPNENILSIIQKLFSEGEMVIEKIGPWDKPRLNHPSTGKVRVTFLVSDKIYFGEGPVNALFNDPLAKGLLQTATSLMQYLTNHGLKNSH